MEIVRLTVIASGVITIFASSDSIKATSSSKYPSSLIACNDGGVTLIGVLEDGMGGGRLLSDAKWTEVDACRRDARLIRGSLEGPAFGDE